jgi:hypothetical protein
MLNKLSLPNVNGSTTRFVFCCIVAEIVRGSLCKQLISNQSNGLDKPVIWVLIQTENQKLKRQRG